MGQFVSMEESHEHVCFAGAGERSGDDHKT
jgi:hypothetical protein